MVELMGNRLLRKNQGRELAREIVRERLKNSSLSDDVTPADDPDVESFRQVVRSALKGKKKSSLKTDVVKKLAGL
jgi:hypothetical protein